MSGLMASTSFVVVGSVVAVVLLALVVIFGVIYLAARTTVKRLEEARRQVERIETPWTREALERVRSYLPDVRVYKEQWEEFVESLSVIDDKLYNSIPIDQFVNDAEFLQSVGRKARWLRFPFLHYLPGVATSAGLLGTFVGIAWGLGELKLDELGKEPIAALIASLSVAFYTSIAGVSLSVLFTVLAGLKESRLISGLHDFHELIDRKIPRVTTEHLLSRSRHDQWLWRQEQQAGRQQQLQEQAEQSLLLKEQLTGQRQQLTAQNESLAKQKEELFAQREQVNVQKSLLKGQGEQTEILDAIRQEAEESRANLQTISNDLADKLGNRFESTIQQLLVPHMQAMTESVQKQVATAGETSTGEARRFADEMVQQISGSLQESFGAMGAQVSQVGEELGGLSAVLSDVVGGAVQAVQDQRQIIQESSQAVAEANRRSADAAGHVASVQELTSKLASLVESVQAQHAEVARTQGDQARLQEVSSKHTAEVASSMSKATQAYAATSERLAGLLAGFEKVVGVLGERVEALSSATATASDSVKRSSTSLVERTQVEEKLLTGFRTASTEFSGAMLQARPALAEVARAASELQESRDGLLAVSGQFDALRESLEESGLVLRSGLTSTQASFRDSAKEMGSVLGATREWVGATTKSIEQFGASVSRVLEDSLKTYDQSLTQAVSSLRMAIRQIDDAAEELAASAERRRSTA